MRIRNDPQALTKLQNSQLLLTNLPYQLQKNDILELGMGKGEMLTELALQNPDKNYIGIEKMATIAAKAAQRATALNLKNLHIILGDIAALPTLVVGQSAEIWLTFSDPWPKKRHLKRRLTHPHFLSLYAQILAPQGTLKLKTDNDAFFAYSLQSLKSEQWKINFETCDLFHANIVNVPTGYEIKWRTRGKNINYLEAVK